MSSSDLTGYAALFGESLTSKVDLLERLIGSAHYPSLGQYKEKLLADAIRDFLPRTVAVDTGFVLFPHVNNNPPAAGKFYDALNQSAFAVSRQCDILIHDVINYPVIFRDGNFVVVRPEAVRAVIEVKGSLNGRETSKSLTSFHDFATKWRRTQVFYREQHVPLTSSPLLAVMAWGISTDASGRLKITPKSVCKIIASFYSSHVDLDSVDGYPFLGKLLVHNETEIVSTLQLERSTGSPDSFVNHWGWSATDGRFTRVSEDGTLVRDKDRTIASLLASLHMKVSGSKDFNRFFSYQDEVRNKHVAPYKYAASETAWSDLEADDVKRIIAMKVGS